MTKEGKPLSAAERIIAALEADKRAKASIEAERLAREKAEQGKLAVQAEQLQEKCDTENDAFGEVDLRLGLTASLEQINARVLGGEGRITSFHLGVTKDLWGGKIHGVWAAGETSVKLEWKSNGFPYRVKVRYCHSSKNPMVVVFGGGWDDEDYEGTTDGTGKKVQIFFSGSIEIDSAEFQEKFQSSLAEAFKHSLCSSSPPEMREVVAG